jgi:lambda repressor-like predicted transcriptional regulator
MNTTGAAGANGADIEIAHQIRNALIVQGITHKELSSRTGIKYSTLRRSLDQTRADRRSLSVQEIIKITAALEVQPSVILPAILTQQDAA